MLLIIRLMSKLGASSASWIRELVAGAQISERVYFTLSIEELVARDSIDPRLSHFTCCTALLLRLFLFSLIRFIEFVDFKLLGSFL